MEESEITPACEDAGPAAADDSPAAAAEQLELCAEAPAREEAPEEALRAVIEAIVYVTEEPASAAQIAEALGRPEQRVRQVLDGLVEEYSQARHGVMIREVAGGFQMTTKPEHHEAIRAFARKLKPPLKLSLAALETLAVIAYRQPITAPEIQAVRGVSGVSVLKTLLDRKLITTAGRKNVVGRPILYKTTKEFLVQFGLKDLSELPTLKEFEELKRLALSDAVQPEAEPPTQAVQVPEPAGENEP